MNPVALTGRALNLQGSRFGCRGAGCVSLALVIAVGMAGCFFGDGEKACNKSQEYLASPELPPMRVPDDLDEPDRSGELEIPGTRVAEPAPAGDGPCLDRPPDYFDKKL